jgi:hypothetical protein
MPLKLFSQNALKKLKETFSKDKTPLLTSNVAGLALAIEKKEGPPLMKQSRSVEDAYYEVTVKSTGDNSKYPANENVAQYICAKSLPGEGRSSLYKGETNRPDLFVVGPDSNFREFVLEQNGEASSGVALRVEFDVSAQKKMADGSKITGLSATLPLDEKLFQKPAAKPAPKA